MHQLLSILLTAAMILSFCPAPGQVPSAAADTDWRDMAYTHYDGSYFLADAERLTELAAGQDADAVLALYDELYSELAHIDTLGSIAYVRSSADVTDEYWTDESQYATSLVYSAADALSRACQAIAAGPCAGAFAEHVGQDAFDAFAEYRPMTDREAELLARETELVDEYYQLINSAGQVTYTYLGESWDLEKLGGFQGANLVYQDYEGYLEVFSGLHDAVSRTVGPVFLDLVQLRRELAQLEGWDSYPAMMYEQTYGRDYSLQDAQTLCDAVKAIGPEIFSLSQHDTGSGELVFSPEELLATLGEYAGRLDPSLADAWQYMTEHGLCDLANGENRTPGAYTITLSQYDSAYIFATLAGTERDLSTLSHEFGHFVNDCSIPVPNLLTSVGNYDLMEIHSTGLETLFTAFYEEIFGPNGNAARYEVLCGLLEKLVQGCLYDEFQRRIYEQPDMTLEDLNRLYADLCTQYGQYEPFDADGTWVYIPHTFESPLYYLSYAASALGAIQLWDMARTDLDAAADTWLALMDHSAYEEGYMTVLPACGMRLFTEPGAVEQICRPLIDELPRLIAG